LKRNSKQIKANNIFNLNGIINLIPNVKCMRSLVYRCGTDDG